MKSSPSLDDFNRFFHELHGVEPFPWQNALARHLLESGAWPGTLCRPTGCGKSALIDIAVFHLAAQAHLPTAERTTGRRIFYVIDRRIVVDEAYERAKTIAEKLQQAFHTHESPTLSRLARRLQMNSDRPPLLTTRLRGGVVRDDSWVTSPEQPMVCVTTVDQIGSRLLFRGYGVSPGMRPIHAALAGNDALYILDEAHLSRPFRQTLESVRRHRRRGTDSPIDAGPFAVVSMSATIDAGDQSTWLTDEVRKQDRRDDYLSRVLEASKPTRMVKAGKGSTPDEKYHPLLVDKLTAQAVDLLDRKEGEPVHTIGVVVNRVRTARDVFSKLDEHEDYDVILLTGRIRPVDRDRILRKWMDRIRAGRERHEQSEQPPLFVVATQTIEVGADLDFDGLVTELAPLDSLRQRFGRVDRRGERGISPCSIVVRHDHQLKSYEDPIYGKASALCWRFLKKQKTGRGKKARVDMGIASLQLPDDPGELLELCAPTADAPLFFPAYLQTLVQTNPTPVPDPDISLFLHGPDVTPPDVQILWRADLPDHLSSTSDIEAIGRVVTSIPPTARETLSLPIWAVKSWLMNLDEQNSISDVARENIDDFADVEGASSSAVVESSSSSSLRVLRWNGFGDDVVELIEIDDISPGDTIIIPGTWGGYDEFGFRPNSKSPVLDVAELSFLATRRRMVLRLFPSTLGHWQKFEAEEDKQTNLIGTIAENLPDAREGEFASGHELRKALNSVAMSTHLPRHIRRAAETLNNAGSALDFTPIPFSSGSTGTFRYLVTSDQTVSLEDLEDLTVELESSADATVQRFPVADDVSSHSSVPVSLDEHLEHVATEARKLADDLGFNDRLKVTLELAAEAHDIGKADPRFQLWLHDGDPVAAEMADRLLAKSGSDLTRWDYLNTRRKAGYPTGMRHECLSVRLLEQVRSELPEDVHENLLLYLVGTHHGYGRPWFPAMSDSEPEDVEYTFQDRDVAASSDHGLQRIGSGWRDLFWNAVGNWGPWRLALLESTLRLADQRVSAREATDE